MSTDPKVHELLLQLHHELKHADNITERDQALFAHLTAHLKEVIDHPDNEPSTLGARLEGTIAEMESDHPRLTLLMTRLASALANMGI